MATGRDEFSARTRSIIARRAGYRCSVPTCRRLTVGPGAGPDDVAEIGTAAHIFSAAANGPRGNGGLSASARTQASNGIWTCADHGRLIDTNDGDAYPPSLLQGWRSLHEATVRLEIGGRRQPFGWLESLEISFGPGVLGRRTFHWAAQNLIIGENNTGKSALLKIIAGIGHPDYLAAFGGWLGQAGLQASVRWYDPEPRDLVVVVDGDKVSHVLDGRRVPYVARPYRTVLVPEIAPSAVGGVAGMAEVLGVDRTTMRALLEELPSRVGGAVTGVNVNGTDLTLELDHEFTSHKPVRVGSAEFGDIAGVVLTEAAIALASFQAEVEPTVLVIDGFLDYHHPAWQIRYLDRVRAALAGFQVVITTHSPAVLAACGPDWLVTEFRRDARGVITQDRLMS